MSKRLEENYYFSEPDTGKESFSIDFIKDFIFNKDNLITTRVIAEEVELEGIVGACKYSGKKFLSSNYLLLSQNFDSMGNVFFEDLNSLSNRNKKKIKKAIKIAKWAGLLN